MNLDKYIIKDLVNPCCDKNKVKQYKNIKERILFGLNESKNIVKKIWYLVLIGVGVGALIHNYVPKELIHSVIAKSGVFSVPIAVILGIPMYGSCAAIVPIAVVLFKKGVPLGTALAFMMAIAGLSFPEAIILKRALKLKLIILFFSITAISIIITGYIFNLLQLLI